ncbi:MAG: FAD:protein FMN transferase [Tannerellaceae bacterium]|jgi:thiamine biosynthesis lipoprotein|nr:FAD:protein FMN transferase [Tannerellaceae bacterium]
MKRNQLLYLVFLLGLLLEGGCSGSRGEYVQESGSVFHTLYRIKYRSSRPLTEKIDAELQTFNLSLNPFHPHSILSKVNRNEPVEVDAFFTDVFRKAQEIHSRSHGAFDPTVAPLINLWGFGFSSSDSVTPGVIDSLRSFVGYDKIHLEGKTVRKDDPRVILNFSAIAKGYACDVIARLLEREGVEDYMVEIGGEVHMRGLNPQGECWRIGIRKPSDDAEASGPSLEDTLQPCKPCGIATSGDYLNFYEKDGRKFAHTIDPATGYPAGQDILSATVVAADCMTADAYATAFMVLGIEKAVETARSIPGIEYFFIYSDPYGNYLVSYSDAILPYLSRR